MHVLMPMVGIVHCTHNTWFNNAQLFICTRLRYFDNTPEEDICDTGSLYIELASHALLCCKKGETGQHQHKG